MKKLLYIFSFVLLNCTFSQGQYVVKSKYILNPDLNIEYVRKNVDFWVKYAYDPTYGGFYSSVDRNGTVLNQTQKSLISQTRHGYGFTKAFMLTGDEKYLTYAKSALDFLFDHGWDLVNDGWNTFAKRDGTLDNRVGWNPNATKYGFQQHYALVGIIANYEATGDIQVKQWIDKSLNSLNTHMWDSRSGYEGYYSEATLNWITKSGKGFTPTVDGITTHGEMMYLLTQNQNYKTRLMQLADNIVYDILPTMNDSKVKVLYPENFNADWAINLSDNNNQIGSVGHFVKTAWCLGRAYLCDTTKIEYKAAAIRILDQTWNYKNGAVSIWDHQNGGPFNSLNISNGGWGTYGDNKNYWTLEQGFTGPMINYYITKNPTYLQMADESLDFFMKHQVDSVYGEIFSELDPTGTIIRSGVKGDDFKASYHSTEIGYYAYLYSNLYYLHQPASLYYKFAASTTTQDIALTPIPMEAGRLRIKSVTLDGTDFNNFDSKTRTLNIAANQGGKFKVTFEAISNAPNALSVNQKNRINVFPNPTSGIINIDGIDDLKNISIVDLTGKVLLEKRVQGEKSLNIDLQHLNNGIYFVVLYQNSGLKMMNKIIKH